MKKVFESDLVGFDESGERVFVFELDGPDERKELSEMSHDELCEVFGVCEEPDYAVEPGGLYHRYHIDINGSFAILTECVAYNV